MPASGPDQNRQIDALGDLACALGQGGDRPEQLGHDGVHAQLVRLRREPVELLRAQVGRADELAQSVQRCGVRLAYGDNGPVSS